MRHLFLAVCIVFSPVILAGQPEPFDFRWDEGGDALLRVEPTDDLGVVFSGPVSLEDAQVPLLQVLHAPRGCEHTEAEHADANVEHVRVLAKKWVSTDTGRYLFVAWSPYHTCSEMEPTHYFKLVDGEDFSREIRSTSRGWQMPE